MLKVVEPPEITEEKLEAIKLHLRVDHDEDDQLIKTLIGATREYAETTLCGRAFEVQTLELRAPATLEVSLPQPPFLEVLEAIVTTGETETPLVYEIDDGREPALFKAYSLPRGAKYMKITYKAGYSSLPDEYLLWQKLMVAHYYENRQAILPIGHNIMRTPFVADYLLQSYRMFGVI